MHKTLNLFEYPTCNNDYSTERLYSNITSPTPQKSEPPTHQLIYSQKPDYFFPSPWITIPLPPSAGPLPYFPTSHPPTMVPTYPTTPCWVMGEGHIPKFAFLCRPVTREGGSTFYNPGILLQWNYWHHISTIINLY